MKPAWKGIFPALVTQFRADETLDLEATARHLDHLIRAGIDGVIVLGSLGENTSLEYAEKVELVREMVSVAGGRVPLLTGVAESTTSVACRYARDAERAGADGLMVLPAMVYKADDRETLAHLRAVARAVALPIMVYNNPVSYHVDITPKIFAQLAEEPTVAAIKESSQDPRRITDLINRLGDRYLLFAGVDDLVLECLLLGAQGWVCGLGNAFIEESRALWDLASCGSWEQARALYRWFTPLLHLDTQTKLVQHIKLAVAELGLGTETTRRPRLPLEGEEREQVLKIIRQAIATRPAVGAR